MPFVCWRGGEESEREGGEGYGIVNSLLMLQSRPPLCFHNVQKDVTKQYYLLLSLHLDWFILIVNWRRDVYMDSLTFVLVSLMCKATGLQCHAIKIVNRNH